MWEYIVEEKIYVTWICEFITASVALFYLWSLQSVKKSLKIFIYYLVFVFFADLLGAYALWSYFDGYRTFPFLKDSVFKRPEWLFNIISVFTFTVITNLIIEQLSERNRRPFRISLVVFVLSWILALIISEDYFYAQNKYVFLSGTFFLVISIGAYFYEMINSDRLLNFYNSPVFFIAVGAMLWHLCVAPLWIYNNFVGEGGNGYFFNIYQLILRSANIFMYFMFSLGFLVEFSLLRKSANKKLHQSEINIKPKRAK